MMYNSGRGVHQHSEQDDLQTKQAQARTLQHYLLVQEHQSCHEEESGQQAIRKQVNHIKEY